ncbi:MULTISPECIES: IclR family transcriptional regulator [unclassified Chelatococcus]|uniref:IclR family transcriptional regulator n=1 Tax=unclassified Chelatococcus TaxID=2638111 RepID=UPI001BD1831D|nr:MULTISPECIES: IclR family transcriptional regulator [unclassified Chelatococcus]CAH1650293.1 IclR family transcriptional regulator [Hyphomicrobiales bacterium]MBS7739713.1 IclR family transcriptional regulator [Chelatococcus sp. HY11]MBX3544082.1 IclR family transcriptional regulator [Chelatococcus sp.]MCO5075751.1 IclR family transcriptional regulator [Chelatococcus sp.]CAH1666452.1 IclR family transcriptional regulator [Hyphomicrobiales bacterium]
MSSLVPESDMLGDVQADLGASDSTGADAGASSSVRVIDRTMRILRVLADSTDSMTLTELSQRVDLHKSTVLRFLKTLEKGGFVAAGHNGKGWRPGPVFLDIRSRSIARHDLAGLARPLMEEACSQTGETVQLAILPDTSVVYLAKVEPLDPPLKLNTQIGARRPIHCTALGKAIAAYRDPAEVDAILKEAGMPAFTARTLTSGEALHEALGKVRADGFAVDDREYNDLVSCVAAPIRNGEGTVVAALSISSLGQTASSPRFAELIAVARDTAARIGELLGWHSQASR